MEKNILSFLQQLAENNHKDWMDANRDWYLQVKSGFLQEVSELLTKMVEIEPGLAALRPKDCIFRQNRDIRFSANKSPYKNNLAAYFAVGGKKSNGPGYYLHIQPGESFMGGGIYFPNPEILKKIRQEIDYSGEELTGILNRKDFKNMFGEIEGDKLKTSPRDYSADHPHIEYLKLKSFIVSRKISDAEILSGAFIGKTLEGFYMMKPFNDFLSKAVEEAENGEGLI